MQVLVERTVEECRARICKHPKRVLLLPPDITRMHSGAGRITELLYNVFAGEADVHVIPTLGQHVPHTAEENRRMFGAIPNERIHAHDWRGGVVNVGEIPLAVVQESCGSIVDWPIPITLNRMLMEEPWDLIINVGHIVPHEVLGFANHNKNYFIGLGGKDLICAAHMMAAVCGIENNLGNIVTPVRHCFNWAEEHFLSRLPDVYFQVVMARSDKDQLVHTGVYVGDDLETYLQAALQSREQNITTFEEPLAKSRLRDAGGRVLQHLGGEQGRLPHANGAGRRRRAGDYRTGPEALRRTAGGRCLHSQVRLLRHGERDGSVPQERRHAGPRPRHSAFDTRIKRGAVPNYLCRRVNLHRRKLSESATSTWKSARPFKPTSRSTAARVGT